MSVVWEDPPGWGDRYQMLTTLKQNPNKWGVVADTDQLDTWWAEHGFETEWHGDPTGRGKLYARWNGEGHYG